MNMPVKIQYFKNPKNRDLTAAELEAFARELDQIKQDVLNDLGEKMRNIFVVFIQPFAIVAFRTRTVICRLVSASMVIGNRFIRFCQDHGKHGVGTQCHAWSV